MNGFKIFGLTLLGFVVAGILALATGLINVGVTRVIAPMQQEIQTQVFEQSRAYLEGMRSELGQYYQEWLQEDDPEAKQGIENYVRARFGDFPMDEVPDYLQSWLYDIRGY